MISSVHRFAKEHNVWIGRGYRTSPDRILILGESTYGVPTHISEEIQAWINGQPDHTFSVLFHACTGLPAADASSDARQLFWESLAYCNFISCPQGVSRRNARPRDEVFEAATERLSFVLEFVNPKAVWILGVEQSRFSERVIVERKVLSVISKHPAAYGVRIRELQTSWTQLTKALLDGTSPIKKQA